MSVPNKNNSSSNNSSSSCCYWLGEDAKSIDCLCLGTGRFLRSVLVPALVEAKLKPALIQTRGSNFLEYMMMRNSNNNNDHYPTYEVDTVLPSGMVETQTVPCHGAFTLGTAEGKAAFMTFLQEQQQPPLSIKLIGVGVTEAGLANSQTQAMQELFQLLDYLRSHNTYSATLTVIDMDNVPENGDVIRSHMLKLSNNGDAEMKLYLQTRVTFCNTMVDRITSQREGSDGMVPKCEPLPSKALVILDPEHGLPESLAALTNLGIVVRSKSEQLQADIALKLRVANGTHTAIAQCMALVGIINTDTLAQGGLWMEYLDSLFESQILPGSSAFGTAETKCVYEDWRNRLIHPYFGLSTFFITQNGASKGGIRFGPTMIDIMEQKKPITTCMVYAWASLLRWLTPMAEKSSANGVFTGWLDGRTRMDQLEGVGDSVEYADGMHYNLQAGWYEFKCACNIRGRPLSAHLADIASTTPQPAAYASAVRDYLLAPDGGDLIRVAKMASFEVLVQSISTLLARMVAGDGMKELLNEMSHHHGIYDEGFATDAKVLVDDVD